MLSIISKGISEGVPPPKYIEPTSSFNSFDLKEISLTIESTIKSFDFIVVEK